MEPTLNEAAAALLDKTFDILLVDGWCQHALENGEGEHCVLGALKVADHGLSYGALSSGSGVTAYVALREHAADRGFRDMVLWNNADDRTFDDILDGVQACAKSLREQAGAA